MRHIPWIVFTSALAAALAGCGEPKTYTPAALPAFERPVMAVAGNGERLTIPRAALIERGGVPGVFVLNGQQQARFRMVRAGKAVGERLEVLAGLTRGDVLVLGDLATLHDGQPIKPLTAVR